MYWNISKKVRILPQGCHYLNLDSIAESRVEWECKNNRRFAHAVINLLVRTAAASLVSPNHFNKHINIAIVTLDQKNAQLSWPK